MSNRQANGWNAKSTYISINDLVGICLYINEESKEGREKDRVRMRTGIEPRPRGSRRGTWWYRTSRRTHEAIYIAVLGPQERKETSSSKADILSAVCFWSQYCNIRYLRLGKKKIWWKLAGLCFCDTNLGRKKNPVLRHFPSIGTLPLTQGPRCFSTIGTRV